MRPVAFFWLLLPCIHVFAQCPACTEKGTDLVTNGGFEQGNTGFTSGYKFFTKLSMPNGGDYGIGKSASNWESSYSCPRDHSGSGNMMIVNGIADGEITAWEQTVQNISPNQDYYFAYWLANISQGSQPQIQLEINNVLQGSRLTLNTQIGVWKQYFITWNSGSATQAKLRIVNTANIQGGSFGNNFAIDDITLFTCNAVKNPPVPKLGSDVELCDLTKLSLDAGAGFDTYVWDDASKLRTREVNSQGRYIVNTTYKGCKASDTIEVKLLQKPIVNLGDDTAVCGGSLLLDAGADNSSYSILWSTGESSRTIEVSSSGIYTVIVSNSKCRDTASQVLSIESPFNVFLGNDTAVCEGQSLRLDAGNEGTFYTWNTGARTSAINVKKSGNYTVKVEKGACSAFDTLSLSTNPLPIANLGKDTMMCKTLFPLTAGCSGCEHFWSTSESTDTIHVFTSGTYKVKTRKNGCENSDSIRLRFIEQPTVNLGNDIVACDTLVVLDAGNPGNVYLWSTGDTSQKITVKQSGLYKVTVGLKACKDESQIKITNHIPPALYLGPDTSLCEGEKYTLMLAPAPAGYTYTWDDGSNKTSRLADKTGTYSVRMRNAICDVADSVDISIIEKPRLELGRDTTLCLGDSILLFAGNTGARFKWNTGDTVQTLKVKKSGYYQVEVKVYRCLSSDDIVITGVRKPLIDLKDHYNICVERQEVLTLNPGDNKQYHWRPDNTYAEQISVSRPGTILCSYTDANLCTSMKIITVEERCDPYLYVPSAFTPDGKYNNNEFRPEGNYIDTYVLEIYNRWGERVFISKDLSVGWDGTYKGQDCPDGVYVWRIAYSGRGKENYQMSNNLSGTVTLLR